jgi:hypothetical protein
VQASDDVWRANMQAHAAALRMVREALEHHGPVGVLPSEEAELLIGPGPHHTAEVLIAGIEAMASQHARLSQAALRLARVASDLGRHANAEDEVAGEVAEVRALAATPAHAAQPSGSSATVAPLCPTDREGEFRLIAESKNSSLRWFCMSELAKMNATQESWEDHWRSSRAATQPTDGGV